MRIFMLFCLMLLVLSTPTALAAEPFAIDDAHVYEGMNRAYAQGYAPTISGGTARIILPLRPGECEGDIEAELIPMDMESTPIKLSNKLTKTIKPGRYTFSGKTTSAYKIDFTLALHASRFNGEYPFAIVVRGMDKAGHALEQRFDYTLRVTDGKANDAPPEVLIESFDAEDLVVGGEGMIHLTAVNHSQTREARDVVLTLSDATGDILPLESSIVRLGDMLPGASVPLEIPVRALHKASAQPHTLELALSFAYADNKTATVSERRTVKVDQDVRLAHTEAALATRVTQGENVAFNLTLMNMGRGVINNALLTFDVPHLADGGSVLAGNIEPGKSAPVTANLRVDADFAGDTSGTLTLTWEDGYGKPFEKAIPLSTTVLKKAALSATSSTTASTQDAPNQNLTLREIVAWATAALLLIVLVLTSLFSSRRIRTLEEKQL